jgi:hypothetical protein
LPAPQRIKLKPLPSELARIRRACVLYRAIPVGYDNLDPSTIEGAQFDLEPLGHDHNVPSPSHWNLASDLINSLHQT